MTKSPTGRLPKPWPSFFEPGTKARWIGVDYGSEPAFFSVDYAEIERRAIAYYGVNPEPYYNWRMCRLSLTVVQLALAAVEGDYRATDCFNHAVDGGIVFG